MFSQGVLTKRKIFLAASWVPQEAAGGFAAGAAGLCASELEGPAGGPMVTNGLSVVQVKPECRESVCKAFFYLSLVKKNKKSNKNHN